MANRVDYLQLINAAEKSGIKITHPWDGSYQKDMTIWNRRLQTGPAMIAFCKTKEDVQLCVNWCRNNNFPLRVRSGGHHHEGMSCDYGVLIIDLSLMDNIRYVDENTAWIPPGKQLQHVYGELAHRNQIIPGGGCETVCVGGLTLGGGWGMYSRALGLTCDNILEAEMVLADGSVCKASEQENCDLFWAIRGGGAGNFGVVTNFKFKLTTYSSIQKPKQNLSTWSEALMEMKKVLTCLGNEREPLPPSTTLACRLYLDDYGVLTFSKTEVVIETLKSTDESKSAVDPLMHFTDSKMSFQLSSTTDDIMSAVAVSAVIADKPTDTCKTGPLPHKVSSAFVKNDKLIEAGEICYKFLQNNPNPFPNAATYISFHSFGGAIGNLKADETAFPYRDRKLLLQFQAWWSDPNDEATELYVDWIKRIRMELFNAGVTDGGFFNFQDASIADDPYLLMKYYYDGNLGKLIEIKCKYDPNDLFNSGMSLPISK